MSAHDGLARAIHPVHSPLDGDTIFAVATGAQPTEPAAFVPSGMNPDVAVLAEICRVAVTVTQRAIVNAVLAADSVAGVPSYADLAPSAITTTGIA